MAHTSNYGLFKAVQGVVLLPDQRKAHGGARENDAQEECIEGDECQITRPTEPSGYRPRPPRRERFPQDHEKEYAEEEPQPDSRFVGENGFRHIPGLFIDPCLFIDPGFSIDKVMSRVSWQRERGADSLFMGEDGERHPFAIVIHSMELSAAEGLLEVRDGPLPGELGGGFVVARRAGIVVEGVPGAGIDVGLVALAIFLKVLGERA